MASSSQEGIQYVDGGSKDTVSCLGVRDFGLRV